MSKLYRTPPSRLLGIEGSLAAFLLDRAVATFGTSVDNDIDKATNSKKGKAAEAAANGVIGKWINDGPKSAQRFRTPTATQ